MTTGKGRNLRSTLKRRARQNPMRDFDALPPALRHWLHGAALPWSPRSARRIWDKALARARGDQTSALLVIARTEAALVARDAHRIWGPDHPACGTPGRTG
jgi:hypothetical protein